MSGELAGETGGQHLVARIKRSSKYWGQTKPNQWFDVRVVADTFYHLRGNNNNYRLSDVALGVRLDGNVIVDFTNGRTIQPKGSIAKRGGVEADTQSKTDEG